MVLPEEQNEQPMRRWRVRHAREREDLSASVEEALTDPNGKIPGEEGLIRPDRLYQPPDRACGPESRV